jgi:hypothetical protein
MLKTITPSRLRLLFPIILYLCLIPFLTSCVQTDISLENDSRLVVQKPYIFDKNDPVLAPAAPLCPLTSLSSYKQETGVWCWAASAQMMINYLGGRALISQCDVVNNALDVSPTDDPNCCKAKDDYVPTSGELGNPNFEKMQARCRVRGWPLDALRKNGRTADMTTFPLNWSELSEQLCTKRVPYISVVQFYDNDGSLAGRHSSVVGGGRITSDGERYVEISDHSNDDFFIMKWTAFEYGVEGDFVHEYDYTNVR